MLAWENVLPGTRSVAVYLFLIYRKESWERAESRPRWLEWDWLPGSILGPLQQVLVQEQVL